MSGPERIWANAQEWPRGTGRIEVYASAKPDPDEPSTEYIRADTVAETIRQAVQAEREACADVVAACADAFAQVAEHPGVDTSGIRRSESMLRGIAAAIRARGDA